MTFNRPGISDEFLTAAGVESFDTPEPYLRIPYHDRLGVRTGHYRDRLGTVRPNGQKYDQPGQSGMHVYFPHIPLSVCGRLWVTEGEFKAMSMWEAGNPTIGLGGLHCYTTDENGNPQILPAFFEAVRFAQPSEIVYIGDSDTILNVEYYRSAHFLAATFPKIPIQLLQVPFESPQKGIDDLRGALDGEFPSRLEQLYLEAVWSDPEESFLLPAIARLEGLSKAIKALPGLEQAKQRRRVCQMAAWAKLTKGEPQAILVQFLEAAQEAVALNKDRFNAAVEDELRRILGPQYSAQTEREEEVDDLLEYFNSIRPWPSLPPLSELLWEQYEKISKYVIVPEHYKIIVASLVPVTYVFTASPFLPLVVFTSPEQECGKTAFMTVLLWSVHRPISSGLLASAGAFRWIDELKGTVVLDEMRTLSEDPVGRAFFNMGFNNSGHPVDTAKIRRSDPKAGINLQFGVNYFKILGGIGSYLTADTLSRSFVIPMQRAFPSELRAIIDYALIEPAEFLPLQRKYTAWQEAYLTQFRALAQTTLREMPSDICGRDRQRLCPSFTIGRIAQDGWMELIEKAARRILKLVPAGADSRFPRLLLRDLYNFAEQQLRLRLANRPSVIIHNKRQNRDFIVTDDLLKAMWALSESPWRAWGKGRRMLNAEELYWLLRDYGIDGSERLRKDHGDFRGLYVDTIFKAFERYRHAKDAASEGSDDDTDDDDGGGGYVRPSTPPSGVPGDISAEVPADGQIKPTSPTSSQQIIENKGLRNVAHVEKIESKIGVGDVRKCVDSKQLTEKTSGTSPKIQDFVTIIDDIPPSTPQAAFCTASRPERLLFLDIETFYPWGESYSQPPLPSAGYLIGRQNKGLAHPWAKDPRRCALRFLTVHDREGVFGDYPLTIDFQANHELPDNVLKALATHTPAGHNLDFDLSVLRRHGISVSSSILDTMIGSRVLSLGKEKLKIPEGIAYCDLDSEELEELGSLEDPNPLKHDLATTVRRFLGVKMEKARMKLGGCDWSRTDLSSDHYVYMVEDVGYLPALWSVLEKELRQARLEGVFRERMRFFPHLNQIKMTGIPIDTGQRDSDCRQITAEKAAVREELRTMFADYRHPIPKSRLKTVKIQTTNGKFKRVPGPSEEEFSPSNRDHVLGALTQRGILVENTQEATLRSKIDAPECRLLLKYTATKKRLEAINGITRSTFSDSRVRAAGWNQLAAVTGRIISTEPNLQQVPRDWRTAFRVEPPKLWLKGDLSQIEMVLIAVETGDENLIELLRSGRDVYVEYGARIFSKKAERGPGKDQITDVLRDVAKIPTLGICYGLTPFGFVRRIRDELGMEFDIQEAQGFFETFWAMFPGIAAYHATAAEWASNNYLDHVRTIAGTRRHLPPLVADQIGEYWPSFERRKKIFINTPIQGSGADLVIWAVNRFMHDLPEGVEIVNLVHDEVDAIVTSETLGRTAETITRAFRETFAGFYPSAELTPKIKFSCGPSWGETEEIVL